MPIVHTVPVRDLIEHELRSDACVCGPRMEFVDDGEGRAVGAVVVHASLDGRELREGDA